ncbi:MAG: GNAT family N-acetyltransferase [Rhodothermales bacterium]
MCALPLRSHRGAYPPFSDHVPASTAQTDTYEVGFAQSEGELDAIQRLRFRVFNLELDEGLDESFLTGKDEDPFDATCHHLLVRERRTNQIIGTYRLQTYAMAEAGIGFYSATEYDLSDMPLPYQQGAVEIGRACIAKAHRSLEVLYLLWRGLGMYMNHNHKRYLFGCCSLTSQDPEEGKQVMDFLEAKGHTHPEMRLRALPELQCYPEGFEAPAVARPKVPRLMRVYLSMGATICSDPALDRMFKTIDYLAFFDAETMDPRTSAYFQYTG